MAISKVIYKTSAEDTGTVWMDVTQKTVTEGSMLSGTTALKNDGTDITGNIATKTSANLTASGATVTAPAGYYASDASKSVASGSASTPATTVTANPSISVNSSTGLITATASATQSVTPTVSAGYVSSGTAGTITVSGSNTSQLTTQGAQTIHPSTTAQSIASGKFLTGAQTIAAVVLENLTAGNIKKDVVVKIGDADDDDCVASVTGTYEGGGGGTSWEQQYVGSVTVADWGDQLNYISLVNYFSTHSDFAYGEIYRITWKNGTQYTCVAEVEIPDNPWTGYVLGNGELWGEQFGNNEPFIAQRYSNDLIFATTETASTTFTLTIEKQVSGGGSSYTLLYSDEETVSTTSTSSTEVATISTGITFGAGETYLVSIRDKAGKRNGYFYGSDSYFYVKSNSFANSTVLYGVCYWLDSSGNIDDSNTLRGVFLYRYYGGNNMGQIQINSRYDSSKGTVDGTYTIKVYKVTIPEPVT